MTTPARCIPGFAIVDELPASPTKPAWQLALLDDHELICDLSRFSLGIVSQQHVRKKYRFSENVWQLLATDDELIRKVELETTRRERSGESKRELAAKHAIRAPNVLAEIMDNPKESARHRIDSAKVLNVIADPGPEAESDVVVIKIDLSAAERAKGQAPNPGDVITIEATARPSTPKQIEDDHNGGDDNF